MEEQLTKEKEHKIMEDYNNSMKEFWDKKNKKDNKVLERLKKKVTKKVYKQILEEIEEQEGFNFSIGKECVGEKASNHTLNVWYNQTVNGGYTGDDFAGDVYIEIEKDKYFSFSYDC